MAERFPNGQKTLLEKDKLILEHFCPFPTVFSKDLYCRHVKTRKGKGKPNNKILD